MRIVIFLGVAIVFISVLRCNNDKNKSKLISSDCKENVSDYFRLLDQSGYWPPIMQNYIYQIYLRDSINCVSLNDMIEEKMKRIESVNTVLKILDEPCLDSLLTINQQTVYRAMITDAHQPNVRMVRINQSGNLIYKVAKYIDSSKSLILITDSTVTLSISGIEFDKLESKIRLAYFWDLSTYEFNPIYFVAETWSFEGFITKNNLRYYHKVNRLNPPIQSNYGQMIKYIFDLVKR
jgi:hypothetical protein